MGCVDCGGGNNWDNCDALEIEKGTNRLPKKLIIQSQAEVAPTGSERSGSLDAHHGEGKRYFVHPDEQLTAFLELERQVLTVTFYLASIRAGDQLL